MTSEMVPSYGIWLVFILPFLGALLMPVVGKSRLRDFLAVAFSLVSAVFALALLIPVLQGMTLEVYNSVIPTSVPWIPELGINVGVLSDPFTIVVSNLVAWVSFLVMVYSLDYMKGDSGLTRYWFFMSFFIGSMQLIVLSDNLLSLFIGWEGVGICSYALIGYYYHDQLPYWVGTPGSKALGEEQAYPPSHAGMKAFVMTRVGDIAMLAGVLILFIYAGTFNFAQLASTSGTWATALEKNYLLIPAALLIFGGAVGKSAQFPLTEWLPDAMAGPAPVSALIHAATMVNAGIVLIVRIGPIFYYALAANPSLIEPFFLVVAWIGAITAFIAATQAMVGYELKKILAYSTVSQIGYMMLALGLAGLTTNFAQGLSAGLFQLMTHAVAKAALFMMAGVLIHTTGSKYIDQMGGLRQRMKLTFAMFLIAIASLSGLPPLGGFWSKDAILGTAWSSGQLGLFAVGAVTAGLTAFYTFRMLGIAFFGQKSQHLVHEESIGHGTHEAGPLSSGPFVALTGGAVAFGILAFFGLEGYLYSISSDYLMSLFGGALVSSPGSLPLDIEPAAITLALAAVGLVCACLLYIARVGSARRTAGGSRFVKGVIKFLENRWYVNAIYYKVFVNAPMAAFEWTAVHVERGTLQQVNVGGEVLAKSLSSASTWFDTNVIERFADRVAAAGQALSRSARRIETGVVENYSLVLIIGLLVMLVVFLVATGLYSQI
jgi:NADH-quinone oxidoreductase subunit L